MTSKQRQTRKYYLHRRLKKAGGRYDYRSKTIAQKYGQEADKYASLLCQEFRYAIQITL